jgi:cell division protein FtsB
MFNKSKKAIAALNKHLGDIDSISNVQEGNTWKASLKDTINLYIGNNSSISQRLEKLYFTKKVQSTAPGIIGIFTDHVYDQSLKQNFKDLISSAIKHIESNGIYKSPNKKNFLHHFGNTEVISGAAFVVLLIYGIGNYFGKLEKDREIIQTESKIKEAESKNEKLMLENNQLRQAIDSLKQDVKMKSNFEGLKNDTIKTNR